MDHIRIFVKYITSILCSTIDSPSVIVDSFNFDHNDNNYNILGIKPFNTIPNDISSYYNIYNVPIIKNVNLTFTSNIVHKNRVLLLKALNDTNTFFYKWLYNNINNNIVFTLISIDAVASFNGNIEFIFLNVIYSLPNIKRSIHDTVVLKNNYNSILFIIKNSDNHKIFPYDLSTRYFIILQQYFSISKSKMVTDIPSCFYNNSKHIITLIHKFSDFKISNHFNIIPIDKLTKLPYNQFIFIKQLYYPHSNNYHNLYIYLIETDIKQIYRNIQLFNDELYQSYNNTILIEELTFNNIKTLDNYKLELIYAEIYKLL
jgi:hypothetical protein